MRVCGSSASSGRSEWVTDGCEWGQGVISQIVNWVTSQSVNMVLWVYDLYCFRSFLFVSESMTFLCI